jgi:hypothetical protein
MAKVTIERKYLGRANAPVEWEALLRIFDTIWGHEARSLPIFPRAKHSVHASWRDASGTEYKATSLDEVGQAYRRYETSYISIIGSTERGYRCSFEYWPAKAEARTKVRAGDEKTAEQLIAAVRAEFPLVAKYVFISYANEEYELAIYVAGLLESRKAPGVSVFVAKRDIAPGADPLKVMLKEQLLRAEALVALCSKRFKSSPWLWWESSAVWALGGIVVPLLIDISAEEFNGPITLVRQGRQFFQVEDMNAAVQTIIGKVCPDRPCPELTLAEVEELERLRSQLFD